MPDFEALIRHQQNKQVLASERLKVVDPIDRLETKTNSSNQGNFSGMQAFFGGILGSIIGTVSILIVFEEGILNIKDIIHIIH